MPASRRVRISVPEIGRPLMLRARTSDVNVFHQVFVELEHALPLNFTPRLIIDVGANVGFSTIFFAERYPQARVIAIEPDAENFAMLEHHVAGYPNVQLRRAALWSSAAEDLVVQVDTSHWARRVEPRSGGGPNSVPSETIAGIIASERGATIDLLKIDIEGSEAEVFRTGSELWLDHVRVLMIECHDDLVPGCRADIVRVVLPAAPVHVKHGEFDVFFRERADMASN